MFGRLSEISEGRVTRAPEFLNPVRGSWNSALRKWKSVHHRRESQAAGADAEQFEAELFHHHFVNQNAGEDHVGARLWQADDFLAFSERQTPEPFSVRFHLLQAEARGLHAFAVIAVELRFHARENARRAAGADELNPGGPGISFAAQRGFEFGADFTLQEIFQPVAAGSEFTTRRWVAVRKSFQQSHRTERETVRE